MSTRKKKRNPSWGMDKVGRLPSDPKECEDMLNYWLNIIEARTRMQQALLDSVIKYINDRHEMYREYQKKFGKGEST